MPQSTSRRDLLNKAAGTAATLGLAGVVSAGTYDFSNAENDVEVVGGWLTSKSGNKHMPVVEVQRQGEQAVITATVKHPQGSTHHISNLRIYDEDRLLLNSMTLDHSQSEPKATFYLNLPAGTKLYAVADCNLHGLWFSAFTA